MPVSGTIPKGEYGGGTVMLWDQGSWEPVAGKSAKDIEKGHLHFRLFGERMKGEWLLVRMKPRGKEKRENWLLRKVEDVHAGASEQLVERELTSVLTGRSMAEIEGDRQGSQSLAGKKGKAFNTAMEQAAQHNAKTVKTRPPRHPPPSPPLKPCSLPRWSMPCPPATTGCMRSNSTAIACWPRSRAKR
jgi:bifunctional non-homologous end joining protein LigD